MHNTTINNRYYYSFLAKNNASHIVSFVSDRYVELSINYGPIKTKQQIMLQKEKNRKY